MPKVQTLFTPIELSFSPDVNSVAPGTDVVLDTNVEDSTILYTLDGSLPIENNFSTIKVVSPETFNISVTTRIRARAFDNKETSNTTKTLEKIYKVSRLNIVSSEDFKTSNRFYRKLFRVIPDQNFYNKDSWVVPVSNKKISYVFKNTNSFPIYINLKHNGVEYISDTFPVVGPGDFYEFLLQVANGDNTIEIQTSNATGHTSALAGSIGLSGNIDLVLKQFINEAGSIAISGNLVLLPLLQESGNINLSGDLINKPLMTEVGSMAVSGNLASLAMPTETGSLSMGGTPTIALLTTNGVLFSGDTNGSTFSFDNNTQAFRQWFDPSDNSKSTATTAVQGQLPIAITLNDIRMQLNAPLSAGQYAQLRVNQNGTGASNLVVTFGTASACTSALVVTGSGNLSNGAYTYKITWLINGYENAPSGSSNSVTVDSSHKQISLTNIVVGPTGTTARYIYRTAAGGSTYKRIATINDNSTTTYTDNISDATQATGVTIPTASPTGTGGWPASGLVVGASSPATLVLAQDDLVCFEAFGFSGATSFTSAAIMMSYTSLKTDGYVISPSRGRTTQSANVAYGWITRGRSSTSGAVSGWVPKQLTIKQGTITVATAPGSGNSFTEKVFKNAAATQIGSTLSLSGTSTNTRGTINAVVPAGDGNTNTSFNCNHGTTGSPTFVSGTDWWSYLVDSPDDTIQVFGGGSDAFNTDSLGTTQYPQIAPDPHNGAWASTEPTGQVVWPLSGTFKYMVGKVTTLDASTTATITLRKQTPSDSAASDTALVLTWSAIGWQSDTSATVHVNAGDFVGYKLARTSGSGTSFTLQSLCIGFLPD